MSPLSGPAMLVVLLLGAAVALAGCHGPPHDGPEDPADPEALFAQCVLTAEGVPEAVPPGETFTFLAHVDCPWDWQAEEVTGRYATSTAATPDVRFYEGQCRGETEVTWTDPATEVECVARPAGDMYLRGLAMVRVEGEARELWSAEHRVRVDADADDEDPEDEPDEETVRISGFVFVPDNVTVAVGTTVVWVNEDAVPHTATADDGEWDTGSLSQGAESAHTFEEPGTFTYHCAFHLAMTASVTVA